MANVLIREATESDVLMLCRLQQQWFEEDNVYGFAPGDSLRIQASMGMYFLVAEVDGEVVGYVAGSLHVSDGTAVIPADETYIEVDEIYVSPPYRKEGIGDSLLDQLLSRARSQNVSHALLYSAVKDLQRIMRFYERHDFQSWYVQMFRKL